MKGYLYWSAYNNVCETMHMDAAPGRAMNGDANACGSSLAKASRDARATPELFVDAVRQFLSTCDARTCGVECHDPVYAGEDDLGFTTRHHGDFLYVVRTGGEDRLSVGMRIVAAGRNTIPFLLKDTAQEIFWGRDTDRENWDLALRMFDDIDVFPGDGHVERLDIRRFPANSTPDPGMDPCHLEMAGEAAVLSLRTLQDAAPIEATLGAAHDQLARADRLVVDLRGCDAVAPGHAGANPDGMAPRAWLALAPYLCDSSMPAGELFADRRVWSIYSKNNAARLVEALVPARAAAQGRDDEETIALVDGLMAEIEEKARRVLEAKRATMSMAERRSLAEVEELVPSPFDSEVIAVADNAPRRVVLLVDDTTGPAAERLAEAVMGMCKVRLVGRATPGAVDYANYLTVRYPEIMASFTYPMSRTRASRDGHGYARTGLPLDLHVPFSPKECEHDVMLEAALGI